MSASGGGVRRDDVRFEYGLTVSRNEMEGMTIYLDGVVPGPVIDSERKSYSFDHHGECLRLVTLATCEQVRLALELGMNPKGFRVVINDLDADASVSLWLLRYPERAQEQRVVEMVEAIGFVDAHGPVRTPTRLHRALSHYGNNEQTSEMLWEDQALIEKWYDEGDSALKSLEKLARKEVPAAAFGIDQDGKWSEFEEVQSFAELYERKIIAAVIAAAAPEETVAYTVAKRSEFVDYDIGAFLREMNEQEKGWGGGSTIGGAPRREGGRRSELSCELVKEIFARIGGVSRGK